MEVDDEKWRRMAGWRQGDECGITPVYGDQEPPKDALNGRSEGHAVRLKEIVCPKDSDSLKNPSGEGVLQSFGRARPLRCCWVPIAWICLHDIYEYILQVVIAAIATLI